MTRYLLLISYLGTQFRAVQKQVTNAEPSKLDPETVQGILEICSKRFNPANEPYVYVSSRTDQGVHALCSSAHVDLVCRGSSDYDPAHLATNYNKYFNKLNLDLRVQDVKIVPDTFHARFNAKSRTYLYRLAVRRPDAPPISSSHTENFPYIEKDRCYFFQCEQFDVELMKEASMLFPGTRDFCTFMGTRAKIPEDKSTVKEMYKLDILPGSPLLSPVYCPTAAHYDFWDIVCQARSFLYRQVRRIVGTLLSVATGHISIEEVRYMLDRPAKESWNNRIHVVPAHGLYLVNVEYDPADLVLPKETEEKTSPSSSSKISVSSSAE